MNDPAVLLYTSDFLTGVMDMTMEERGQYITLLCYQHQKGHIKEETIWLLVGSCSVTVLKHFIKDDEGLFYNNRMDIEKEKRQNYTNSRRNNGKLGGRPPKKDNNEQKPYGYPRQNHMGNDNDNENIINKIIYFENKILNDLFLDFLSLRKKLKAQNTERAIQTLINKLNEYDDNIKIKMIENSIMNSWKGLFELKNNVKSKKNPDWFNKKIETEELSKEELEEMNKILKEIT